MWLKASKARDNGFSFSGFCQALKTSPCPEKTRCRQYEGPSKNLTVIILGGLGEILVSLGSSHTKKGGLEKSSSWPRRSKSLRGDP